MANWFQFSVRGLLVGMAVISVFLFVMSQLPLELWFSLSLFALLIGGPILLYGVVYGVYRLGLRGSKLLKDHVFSRRDELN